MRAARDRAAELAQITGLPLDPYFAAPKMTWLRENLTADGVVTTTDTWLLARLGGGYVTDAATASRTLLLDLDAADWSAQACAAFGVDPGELPPVADCAAITGETSAFGPAVPVAGLAVDQQAALLAERCFAAGQAKCTYGTGAFLLATTGPAAVRSARGLSASVAWRLAGTPTYCLDGQVYTAGAAVRWLTEVGLLATRTRSTRSADRSRTAAARRSCPRWPGSARRTGARRPAGRSSGSASAPPGPTWSAPRSTGSPPRSRCWPARWPATSAAR